MSLGSGVQFTMKPFFSYIPFKGKELNANTLQSVTLRTVIQSPLFCECLRIEKIFEINFSLLIRGFFRLVANTF